MNNDAATITPWIKPWASSNYGANRVFEKNEDGTIKRDALGDPIVIPFEQVTFEQMPEEFKERSSSFEVAAIYDPFLGYRVIKASDRALLFFHFGQSVNEDIFHNQVAKWEAVFATTQTLANSIGTRTDDPAPPVPDKLRVSVGITNAANSLRNYAATLDYVESKLNDGIIPPEEAVATVRALWDELQAIVSTTKPFSER